MRFLMLGESSDALWLARAAAALGHELIAYCEVETAAAELAAMFPAARRAEQWERLLDERLPTLAALGPNADEATRSRRETQLRQLAQGGGSLLLAVPCCSSILGFELDMIRAGGGIVLAGFSLPEEHPASRELVEWTRRHDSPLGVVERCELERTLPVRDEPHVLWHLARDTMLVNELVGDVRRVSAMREAAPGASSPSIVGAEPNGGAAESRRETYAGVSVQLGGERSLARWTAGPVDELPGLSVTVVGAKGRAQLTLADDGTRGRLVVAGREQVFTEDDSLEAGRASWRRFASAVEQSTGRGVAPDAPADSGNWNSVCRALEAADNVPASARRGRTLEMHTGTPTEEDTFKSMMAAGSCLLLSIALLVLLVGGLIEGVRLPSLRRQWERDTERARATGSTAADAELDRSPWPLVLRMWPVYPFAILLVLQLLRLVFPRGMSSPGPGGESLADRSSGTPP